MMIFLELVKNVLLALVLAALLLVLYVSFRNDDTPIEPMGNEGPHYEEFYQEVRSLIGHKGYVNMAGAKCLDDVWAVYNGQEWDDNYCYLKYKQLFEETK